MYYSSLRCNHLTAQRRRKAVLLFSLNTIYPCSKTPLAAMYGFQGYLLQSNARTEIQNIVLSTNHLVINQIPLLWLNRLGGKRPYISEFQNSP